MPAALRNVWQYLISWYWFYLCLKAWRQKFPSFLSCHCSYCVPYFLTPDRITTRPAYSSVCTSLSPPASRFALWPCQDWLGREFITALPDLLLLRFSRRFLNTSLYKLWDGFTCLAATPGETMMLNRKIMFNSSLILVFLKTNLGNVGCKHWNCYFMEKLPGCLRVKWNLKLSLFWEYIYIFNSMSMFEAASLF